MQKKGKFADVVTFERLDVALVVAVVAVAVVAVVAVVALSPIVFGISEEPGIVPKSIFSFFLFSWQEIGFKIGFEVEMKIPLRGKK